MTTTDDSHGGRRRARESGRGSGRAIGIGVVVVAAVVLLAWLGRWAMGPESGETGAGSEAGRLNVLLITLDTTRADYLGCYGHPEDITPSLDRLAREGTLFERCTTCSPITFPSHSSILTGVYPYVHGVRQNGTSRLAQVNVTLAETLRDAGYKTQATVASFVLNEQFGIGQGFDAYHDVRPGAGGNPQRAERKGDEVCDDALAMLDALAPGPFFLWAHFYDPHFPYESPRTPDTLSPLAYADEVTFADAQVGRLLEKLERLHLTRDTLVAVVADHGEGLGEHEEQSHGYFLYETTLRVGLILRWPGRIPANQRVAAQVRTIDVAPTILELAGQPAWEHAQGVSLVPLIDGNETDLGLAAYAESFDAYVQFGLSPLRSLTQDGWKYVLAPKPEVYHLDGDPRELQNVFAAHADRAAQMREQLRRLIAEAPEPPSADEASERLSAQVIARLETLGYVGSGKRIGADGSSELERFEPRGGNPKDCAPIFDRVTVEVEELLRQTKYKEMEDLVREFLEAMPEAGRLHAYLGQALGYQGRAQEAIAAFEQAVALSPDNPNVRRNYGVYLRRIQRYEEALAQFRALLEFMPDDVETLLQAALTLGSLGRYDEAEQHARVLLDIDPQDAGALHVLGLVRARQGRFAEAVELFDQALAIEPDFPACRNDRQRAAARLRR